jgi:pyridinium-3,5-bisthiocarboxylic acid mononucleotide nickel chelatase
MVVIIDPQNAGIAGNMVLGALIDLGADIEGTKSVMEHFASPFGKININLEKLNKKGLTATQANIEAEDQDPIGYTELVKIIKDLGPEEMPSGAFNLSLNVFKTLAQAEARVHGIDIEEVHFHEVGAADAVADVMGSAYAFYDLKLQSHKVYGLPVALGGGVKETKHGILSIPAPATLEILKNTPTRGGPVTLELTTPTGAALYINMVDEYCEFQPSLTRKLAGYGAGRMDLDFPNVLRIIKGVAALPTDQVALLETNLDNVSGEILGNLFNQLMEKGALDVSMIPILMKKNRPGHLLRVIVRQKDTELVSEAIIRETGTLGVRVIPFIHRNILEREIIPIEIKISKTKAKIHIKVGKIGQEIINTAPEYEDARQIAEKMQIPVKEVMRIADEAFWHQILLGLINLD